MRNYILHTIGERSQDTVGVTTDKTPEELMFETIREHGVYRMDIFIMEVDTLLIDEEDYTLDEVFSNGLFDSKDGKTHFGITRMSLWEMVPTLVKG